MRRRKEAKQNQRRKATLRFLPCFPVRRRATATLTQMPPQEHAPKAARLQEQSAQLAVRNRLSFPRGDVDFWKAPNHPQSHHAKDQSSLDGGGGGVCVGGWGRNKEEKTSLPEGNYCAPIEGT